MRALVATTLATAPLRPKPQVAKTAPFENRPVSDRNEIFRAGGPAAVSCPGRRS